MLCLCEFVSCLDIKDNKQHVKIGKKAIMVRDRTRRGMLF